MLIQVEVAITLHYVVPCTKASYVTGLFFLRNYESKTSYSVIFCFERRFIIIVIIIVYTATANSISTSTIITTIIGYVHAQHVSLLVVVLSCEDRMRV